MQPLEAQRAEALQMGNKGDVCYRLLHVTTGHHAFVFCGKILVDLKNKNTICKLFFLFQLKKMIVNAIFLFLFLITNSSFLIGSGLSPEPGPSPRSKMVPVLGPGPWSRSRSCHIYGPSIGPGSVIFLVPALVPVPFPVKMSGPITQWKLV